MTRSPQTDPQTKQGRSQIKGCSLAERHWSRASQNGKGHSDLPAVLRPNFYVVFQPELQDAVPTTGSACSPFAWDQNQRNLRWQRAHAVQMTRCHPEYIVNNRARTQAAHRPRTTPIGAQTLHVHLFLMSCQGAEKDSKFGQGFASTFASEDCQSGGIMLFCAHHFLIRQAAACIAVFDMEMSISVFVLLSSVDDGLQK